MTLAGFIELIAKIKQKNNGDYPLVDAEDIECEGGKRLDVVLNEKLDKNQGAENANKVLGIGADGNVTPIEMSAGVKDYNNLENKPSINGVELKGQLTSEDLGIIAKVDNILKGEIKKSLNPSVDDSFKRELWNLKMYGKSTQVTTTGKNLFDIEAMKKQENYQDSSYGYKAFAINVQSGKSYTFNRNLNNGYNLGLGSCGFKQDIQGSMWQWAISATSSTLNRQSFTFTPTTDVIYFSVDSVAFNNLEEFFKTCFFETQFEEGAEPTNYEPYTGQKPSPSPDYKQDVIAIDKFNGAIRRNYQIFDKSKIENKTVGGINVSVENDGIHLNGTTTTTSTSFRYELSGNEEIKKLFRVGNLNIKNNLSPTSQTVILTIYLYNNSVSLGQAQQGSPFLITEDILNKLNRVSFFFFITASQTINCVINPMVYQEGDGTFQPFDSEPQNILYTPTKKMYSTLDGSISDFVDVQNGKEVYNMSGVVVLDGSRDEVWDVYAFKKGFSLYVPNFKGGNLLKGWCDKFNVKTSLDETTGIGMGLNNNYLYAMYVNDIATTVEEWRAWLSQNPIAVVYPLATPTEIPIDEEKLAILRKLYSYEGVTNFLCNSEVSCNYEISQQINNERLWQAINANKLNIATM